MDRKGSVEWRIIWIIVVIASLIVAIMIVYVLFYASSSSNPFGFFNGLLGGGA